MSAVGSIAPARAGSERRELAAALGAVRTRLGLVALLLALAGLAWWSTADRMAGMDAGPGTALGALGWFLGIWVVMMAAMMFPSLSPTVALYTTMTRRHGLSRPLLFTAAYLFVWGAAGLLAYGLFELGTPAVRVRAGVGRRRTVVRRRRARARRGVRVDAAQGRLPVEVPQSGRVPARRAGARGESGRSKWVRDTPAGASAAAGR